MILHEEAKATITEDAEFADDLIWSLLKRLDPELAKTKGDVRKAADQYLKQFEADE